MDIQGKLVLIIEPTEKERGVTKTGEQWKKHTVVIEYQGGDYTKRVAATVFSKETANRWATLNLKLNNEYTFSLDIDAREWNGRWFNDVSIWKAEPLGAPVGEISNEPIDNAAQIVQSKFKVEQPVQVSQPAPQTQQVQNERLPF